MTTPEEAPAQSELEKRLQADRREEKARRDAALAHDAEVDAKIAEHLDDAD